MRGDKKLKIIERFELHKILLKTLPWLKIRQSQQWVGGIGGGWKPQECFLLRNQPHDVLYQSSFTTSSTQITTAQCLGMTVSLQWAGCRTQSSKLLTRRTSLQLPCWMKSSMLLAKIEAYNFQSKAVDWLGEEFPPLWNPH